MSKGTAQFLAQSKTFVAPVKSHFQACEAPTAKDQLLPLPKDALLKEENEIPSSSCCQGLQTGKTWLGEPSTWSRVRWTGNFTVTFKTLIH